MIGSRQIQALIQCVESCSCIDHGGLSTCWAPQSTEINTVFFALFNIMGVYPALYAAVLNPSARSRNSVPSSAPLLNATVHVAMSAASAVP